MCGNFILRLLLSCLLHLCFLRQAGLGMGMFLASSTHPFGFFPSWLFCLEVSLSTYILFEVEKKKKPNKLLFSSNAVKPATSVSDWAWTVKPLSLSSDGLHGSSKFLFHLEDTSAPLQDSNYTRSPLFFCEGVQSSIRSQHTSVKRKSNQLSNNRLLFCKQLLTSLKATSSV